MLFITFSGTLSALLNKKREKYLFDKHLSYLVDQISEYYWVNEVPKWIHCYGIVTLMNKATRADWIDNEYNKVDDTTKNQLKVNWKRGLIYIYIWFSHYGVKC